MAVFSCRRVAFGLALLCVVAYAPALRALANGGFPFGGDALTAFGPWHEFTRTALLRGTLPLWNPHVFCGMPFLANGQSAVLYGPNIVYLWLPLPTALLCDAWLHNVVLALGTYVFARSLGMSRLGALLAAATLALCGAVSARIYVGHMTWHATRAWIPWLLWALLGALRGEPRALLMAVFGALLLSAGHPPMALLGFGLCAGLVFAFALTRRLRGEAVPKPHALALAGLLMLTLSAATVLPMLESSRLSTHDGFGFEFATRGSGTWKSLLRLLLPQFFGGNTGPQWSLPLYGHEEAASLGLLAGLLAVAAPLLARHQGRLPRAVPWLWLLLPLAFVLAMGKRTPVYGWAFTHLPIISLLRVPVRWLELWLLPGALLAGFSFDGLLVRCNCKRASRSFRRALGAMATLLALLALAIALSPLPLAEKNAPWWFSPSRTGALASLTPFEALRLQNGAVVAALVGFALSALAAKLATDARHSRHRPLFRGAFLMVACGELLNLFWLSAPRAEQTQSIAWPPQLRAQYQAAQRWETALGGDIPRMNGGMNDGIDLFNGYDPAAPRRFFHFASALEGYVFFSLSYEAQNRNALLRVAGVTHSLRSDFTLHPYSGAWPRVYLAERLVRQPENRQLSTLNQPAQRDFDRQKRPVVIGTDAWSANAWSANAWSANEDVAQPGTVFGWRRELNRLDVSLDTQSAAVLVVGEAYYPGWRAFARQGERWTETAIAPANYLFRGVALPPGTQHVTMVYEPQTARLGLFFMLMGILALTCGATTLLLKRHLLKGHL